MEQVGFSSKWRKWIISFLDSAYASILINGSPTKEFKIERGLRQGDSLSPFLFILVVEALNVAMLEAIDNNHFHGIKVRKDKIHVSHLQFADDALILGLSSEEVHSIASAIGCLASQFPYTYLGLPIGAKMSRCHNWEPLIDRFQKRLSKWKANSLSFGGLALDTPYEPSVSVNKTYDESYCDRLFATIREKKKNPEAVWPFAPAPPSGKPSSSSSSVFCTTSNERKQKSETLASEIDEEEVEAVWKDILARKGLPLDTPYKPSVSLNKADDESYCDRLFLTIHEKKKNPEAVWPFAPASPKKTNSRPRFRDHFGEKANKKIRSINRITYQDEVSRNKRIGYINKRREKNIQWFKEREARFGPAANNFLRHY
uniref:Reverse transcriptase domain-containing protein n=1 Tax=Tanacetum cinerariifolium TaxID=118510 RepID=A0A6L2P7C0_TANCI|nr:hypothetical protein [Tanacetum cinerariifolium]